MISGYIEREELLANHAETNQEYVQGVPLFIPKEEAYFWTPEWQEGERAAEREITEGRARRFDNWTDAHRWLESDED